MLEGIEEGDYMFTTGVGRVRRHDFTKETDFISSCFSIPPCRLYDFEGGVTIVSDKANRSEQNREKLGWKVDI